MILRDYQQRAIDELRNILRSRGRCPLLVAPAGADHIFQAGMIIIADEAHHASASTYKRILRKTEEDHE